MKLGLKLTCGLLGGIVAVSLGTEVLRYRQSAKSLASFSNENIESLEQREWRNAANVYQVAEHVVMDALVEGEMGKIENLLQLFSGVGGVDEYTFYDADGKAVYSSEPSFLRQVLPQDLQHRLANLGNTLSNSTAQSFDFYRPILVTAKCLECHESLQPGTVGAFTHLAVSNREVTQARGQWLGAMSRMSRAERTKAVVAASILVVVFSALAFVMVRHLITRPLDRVIRSLRASTGEVRLASESMTLSSQAIADGASQQAASLEETSASLEEMASMTRLNAASAGKAKEITQQTRTAAEAGAADMHTMSQVIGEIKASSDNVAKIVSAIDEIAFQTNMLALNAAVEAARAGQAGAGFAVVADEVRTLAQRAAQAARETASKIEAAIAKSSEAVDVSSGMAGRLQEIVDRVRQVDELVAQVATASQDQSQGITQVNLAVSEMDRITQQNAASAEESASGAMELHSQAETLDHAVGDLLRVVDGDDSPGSTSNEPREASSHPQALTPTVRSRTRPVTRELVPS